MKRLSKKSLKNKEIINLKNNHHEIDQEYSNNIVHLSAFL
jgi:hypothetical protein